GSVASPRKRTHRVVRRTTRATLRGGRAEGSGLTPASGRGSGVWGILLPRGIFLVSPGGDYVTSAGRACRGVPAPCPGGRQLLYNGIRSQRRSGKPGGAAPGFRIHLSPRAAANLVEAAQRRR